MKIKQEWQQAVTPKAFWGAIAVGVLLVALCSMATTQTSLIYRSWFWLAGLLCVLGASFFQYAQYGRRAFPPMQLIFLTGYILFSLSHLLQTPIKTAMEWTGLLMIGAGWFTLLFDVKGRRERAIK